MADVDEKTKKARAERREKLLAWYEEKDLPPVIGDYELRIIDEQHDRIYYAFGWFHKSNGWKIRVLYDEETADYMVKMDLHMITLTEIECITGDLEEFKRLVKLLTPEAIEKELIHREKVSILVEGKGFMVWDYEELLPEKLGHYVRVIAPKMPLLGLNGSYIIAAYECEEKIQGSFSSITCIAMNTTASFAPRASLASFISTMRNPSKHLRRRSRSTW